MELTSLYKLMRSAHPVYDTSNGHPQTVITVARSVRAPSSSLGGCYDVSLLPFPMPSPIPARVIHPHPPLSSSSSSPMPRYIAGNSNIEHRNASLAHTNNVTAPVSLKHTSWPIGPANRQFLSSQMIEISPSIHNERSRSVAHPPHASTSSYSSDNRRYAATMPLPSSDVMGYSNSNGSQSARGHSSMSGHLKADQFFTMMNERDNQMAHSQPATARPRVGDIGWGVDLSHTMHRDYGHGHIQGLHERQVVTDLHHSFTHLKGHPIDYRRQRAYAGAHYRTTNVSHAPMISPFVRAHRAALAARPKPSATSGRQRRQAHVVSSMNH